MFDSNKKGHKKSHFSEKNSYLHKRSESSFDY